MKLHIKEDAQIGDRVYAPYRDFKKSGRWELGEIIDIVKDYVCCKRTDNEHIHPRLYSVKFDDGTISHGFLNVAEPQWYEE